MERLTPISRRVVWKGSLGAWSIRGSSANLSKKKKRKKGGRTVVWLYFSIAYGSIPHNLIQAVLDHYHIPHHIQGMITSYLGDIKLRFQPAMFTTKWEPVEKGTVTGCAIPPNLFVMGMNLIISAANTKSKGPKTAAGSQQPAIRAFMDDLTVITPTHVQARWVLAELDRMATWAKMIFNPKRSRCPVIQNGKSIESYLFKEKRS